MQTYIARPAIKNQVTGEVFELQDATYKHGHFDVRMRYRDQGIDTFTDCIEGFMTSENVFVDRNEAALIAFEAKQTPTNVHTLFSYHI